MSAVDTVSWLSRSRLPRRCWSEAIRRAPSAKDQVFIVNLSGRGDKDIDIYRENMKELEND